MFSLTAVESALHKTSLCSRACVFNRAYLKIQIKFIPPASLNSASVLSPTHILQAPRCDGVLLRKQTKYIPTASTAHYCSFTPSLPKHVLQALISNEALLLQRHTERIPQASINSSSASYCSCTPSSPKHVVLAPSSPFTGPASTAPCSRLLAASPSCLESKRSVHHSNLSCTRASTPLMKSSKSLIDRSLVPELLETDLIETAIKGWGPGGQAVNKTSNAVFLKHVPTGLSVKAHMHRMQHKNALEARKLLLDKLDVLVNGPKSVSAQKARLLEKRSIKSESKARKLRDLKVQWKQALIGEDPGVSGDTPKDQGDDLKDQSGSVYGSRYERAGNLGVDSGHGSVDSKVGNWEQGSDKNKRG